MSRIERETCAAELVRGLDKLLAAGQAENPAGALQSRRESSLTREKVQREREGAGKIRRGEDRVRTPNTEGLCFSGPPRGELQLPVFPLPVGKAISPLLSKLTEPRKPPEWSRPLIR